MARRGRRPARSERPRSLRVPALRLIGATLLVSCASGASTAQNFWVPERRKCCAPSSTTCSTCCACADSSWRISVVSIRHPRSYQSFDRSTIFTTESMTGTSIKTPTTVASAGAGIETKGLCCGNRELEEVAGAIKADGARLRNAPRRLPVEQIRETGVEIDLDHDGTANMAMIGGSRQDLLALESEENDQRRRAQRGRPAERRRSRLSVEGPPLASTLRRRACNDHRTTMQRTTDRRSVSHGTVIADSPAAAPRWRKGEHHDDVIERDLDAT